MTQITTDMKTPATVNRNYIFSTKIFFNRSDVRLTKSLFTKCIVSVKTSSIKVKEKMIIRLISLFTTVLIKISNRTILFKMVHWKRKLQKTFLNENSILNYKCFYF